MEINSIINSLKQEKEKVSIGIIWLLQVSAIIGIASGFEDWFISLSPLNLLVLFAIILWNSDNPKQLFYILLILYSIGVIAEFLGVNFNLIFGSYTYGSNLGFKILGVPLLIGINWAILTYVTCNISRLIHPDVFLSSIIAALLMTSLDVLIEVSAPRFDYWEFEGGYAPIQNYIGWYFVSLIACFIFQKFYNKGHFIISFHIFTSITVFFSVFLYI